MSMPPSSWEEKGPVSWANTPPRISENMSFHDQPDDAIAGPRWAGAG